MILLDLDGVLADFNAAACMVHKRQPEPPTRWNYFEDWGMTADEFWSRIHDFGGSFYEDIVQPYPWTLALMETIKAADDFVIVTTPSSSPWCYYGKRVWVDRHLGKDVCVEVVTNKTLMSKPGHLLIDDRNENVTDFTAADLAGEAVLFPQPWNENDVFTPSRLEYLDVALEDWKANLL